MRYSNAKTVNAAIFDHTNGAAAGYSERLNGSANEKYGLARSLSVMPGDTIKMEVYAKYVDPTTSNWTGALSTLMSQIAANTAGVVVDGTAYGSSTASFPGGYGGLVSKSDNGAPRAYLNWLIFDRNFGFITGGFKQITTTAKEAGADVAHEKIQPSSPLVITQPGYVYVYLSNEETTYTREVYWDDFKVTQVKSPVIQTDDYFPFGLTFNSYARENSVANQYLYNGKEMQDELDLGWLDYGARMYMAEIGRFAKSDPLSEAYTSYSPFSYAINNPIYYNDRNGEFKVGFHAEITRRALRRVNFGRSFHFTQLLVFASSYHSDFKHPQGDIHFDGNGSFVKIEATWKNLNSKIESASIGNTNFAGRETVEFGKLLHNVQDFYAHSNYIELFVSYYQKQNNGQSPSSMDIPTFDEVLNNPAYSGLLNYLKENKIKTGEFKLGRWLLGIDRKVTNQMNATHHDELAKDEPKGMVYLFDLAFQVALKHTSDVLQKKVKPKVSFR